MPNIFQDRHPFSVLLQLTYQVIESARVEEWERVMVLNNRYFTILRDEVDNIHLSGLGAREEEKMVKVIDKLLKNEKEICVLIKNRLMVLQTDIGKLYHSVHSSNAYTIQLLQI